MKTVAAKQAIIDLGNMASSPQGSGWTDTIANGQALAHIYFEDGPGRRSAAHLMSRDEARRITVDMVELPESLAAIKWARRDQNSSIRETPSFAARG